MVTLVNRAKMTTSTTGTGPLTLGTASDGFQSFADAGITDGQTVRYTIEDGSEFEIGTGTYTASGTTLTRSVDESSNADAPLNLTGGATVFVVASSLDIQQPPSEGAFVDGDKTKLNGIESGADVTDTANVTSAGALMDSEVDNLADVKSFDPADYATAAQGDLADSSVQPGDSPSFGSVTVTGTVDGRDVAADGSKLDGIEVGATADQTAGEIKTAYESNADTNAFTDSEQSKLAGIEAGADVTDTANVTAAGALMDSEVTNLADVKAFDPADYVTETGATGSAELPAGTTAQRDGTPSAGYIRFNTSDSTFEGYDGSAWGAIGGSGPDLTAVDSNILPDTDATYNVGSTSLKWSAGYFDNISDGTTTVGTEYVVNGSAKAWVNFNGTGTIAIRDSENVASLTDNGTGKYDVSFSNTFSAVDYAASIGGRKNDSNDDGNFAATTGNTTRVPTTSFCPLTCAYAFNGGTRDFPSVYLNAHGDLA